MLPQCGRHHAALQGGFQVPGLACTGSPDLGAGQRSPPEHKVQNTSAVLASAPTHTGSAVPIHTLSVRIELRERAPTYSTDRLAGGAPPWTRGGVPTDETRVAPH